MKPQVRTTVAPDPAMSANDLFMLATLKPIRPTQYEFSPTTVNGLPLSVNFWPETDTKPVGAGAAGAEVGAAVVEGIVADVGASGTVVVAGALVAAPGRHWK